MKKKLLVALLATISVSAYAAETTEKSNLTGLYLETGPLVAQAKAGNLSVSNTLVQVVGGYNIDKYSAIEVFAAKGITEDKKYGHGVGLSIDQSYGAYLKGMYPVNETFTPYVKFGVTNTTLKATYGSASASTSESSFSYGVGANFNLTKQTYLSAGYTRLYKDKEGSIDAYNLNVGYKF